MTEKIISYYISSKEYDIYKDSNNNYLAIKYSSCNGDSSCDADYEVAVYDATLTSEELIYIDEDMIDVKEHFHILNNVYDENSNLIYTENEKYNLETKEVYYADKTKNIFGKEYFKFELVK